MFSISVECFYATLGLHPQYVGFKKLRRACLDMTRDLYDPIFPLYEVWVSSPLLPIETVARAKP